MSLNGGVLNLSVSAAAGRVNFEYVAGLHVGLPNMVQGFDLTLRAHNKVTSHLPCLTASHAEGAVLAAVRQNAGCHGFEKTHTPHTAVAALPAARAA